MFLKIIDDAETIKKCRQQFVRRLRSSGEEKIPIKLGHLGASVASEVFWSERLGIWMSFGEGDNQRYNHSFGVGKPLPGGVLAATGEINFPAGGIDRRTGGAFARDRKGQIYVVHRGKIGGGRRGIGKSLFDTHYRGLWALMEDGEQESVVAVIGVLKSPRFSRHLGHFIHKIDQIKSLAGAPSPQAVLSFSEVSFREEFTGTRQCEFYRDMAGLCDQGIIVRDLFQTLQARGFRVANDPFRDLFLLDAKGRITTLFHVKTDTLPASLHGGVTQLLLQSLNLNHRSRLILVVPAVPETEVWDRLRKMNVELLIYTWQEENASFPELENILPADSFLMDTGKSDTR
jgi:hypothetical protein